MESLRDFGFMLKDVTRLHVRNFERLAGELSLTLDQCRVLAYLSRYEGLSQARLAEITDTDPMTLTRTLDRMQREGWVERRRDPNDRRAHNLYLTPAAGPLLEAMWKVADASRLQSLAGFSPAECIQFSGLLARMQTNLLTALSGGAPDDQPLPAATAAAPTRAVRARPSR